MALYFIGLGLADEKDITVKGLGTIKNCDFVYLENYTSILPATTAKKIEQQLGRKIIIVNREFVESGNEIVNNSRTKDVAFLVVGDPLSATTHVDLFLKAKKEKIKTEIIHNASILSAVAVAGLQLYKFGRTASIPFPEKSFEPESFYDIIKVNKKNSMHTLLLLDLKPEENKFMTIEKAVEILLKIENKRKEKVLNEKTLAVACARVGSKDQVIKAKSLKMLKDFDFGMPPYCLIIPAELHFVEEEMLRLWD